MRITIRSSGSKDINLRFPTRLIFNSFTGTLGAGIVNKYVGTENGFSLKARDLRRLMKVINRIKKKNPGLNLVEVEDADGDGVVITL